MTQDPVLERYLAGVDLVRGRGDPERARLCVMTLVSRLGGEAHTDRPATASPAVAAFARTVNDAMDRATRQRLIAFAPRLRGTNDGRDVARQALLHATLTETLLPAAVRDLRAAGGAVPAGRDAEALVAVVDALRTAATTAEQARIARNGAWDDAALIQPLRAAVAAHAAGDSVTHAEAVARVLAAAVGGVARPSRRDWYWDLAIATLDALCEPSGEGATPVTTTREAVGEVP